MNLSINGQRRFETIASKYKQQAMMNLSINGHRRFETIASRIRQGGDDELIY
jgi:hypothetical protein